MTLALTPSLSLVCLSPFLPLSHSYSISLSQSYSFSLSLSLTHLSFPLSHILCMFGGIADYIFTLNILIVRKQEPAWPDLLTYQHVMMIYHSWYAAVGSHCIIPCIFQGCSTCGI